MSRKILINVMHPEEARVAIVQDGRLMELNIEISGKEQTKGNIYKGVVLRVEPGLQAAFVDIGQKKPGFIQMGDLHPDFWQWRDDMPEDERKRRPRIQDVLRRGQELLVQVEKDARDNKGSALTSYLSLPGRYMVLMPGDDASGISRKIEDNAVRKELKGMVAELHVPNDFGYIVRTEAVGRSLDEMKKDLEYLLGVYDRIRRLAGDRSGASEIYHDAGVIIRTIRDYFSDDIDEVLVDNKVAYQQAIDFFKDIMPGKEKLVKLHREKRPIFSRYQIEEQIDQLYEKRVPLPSGGSLIIEPTEALVSIDVNSGKSIGERGVEDTAFKTNLEAAAEVARQLRLRDLGGLVVIDFIDMRDNKHNKDVERALKEALKLDKARVNIGRISQFGMLEMSRQRIARNINDAIHLECPHCEGRGRVKSVEAMAITFLRKVHAAAAKGQIAEVRGGLPLEVAYFLLNRKKRELAQIENDYDIVVTIKGKPSFLLNQLELESVKKDKQPRDEASEPSVSFVESEPPHEESESSDASGAVESGAKKKRKRRRKKKGAGEQPLERQSDSGLIASDAESEKPEMESLTSEISAEVPAEPAKRSRRSRPRKKPASDPASGQAAAVDDVVSEVQMPVASKQADTKKHRVKVARSETEKPISGKAAIDGVAPKKRAPKKSGLQDGDLPKIKSSTSEAVAVLEAAAKPARQRKKTAAPSSKKGKKPLIDPAQE